MIGLMHLIDHIRNLICPRNKGDMEVIIIMNHRRNLHHHDQESVI